MKFNFTNACNVIFNRSSQYSRKIWVSFFFLAFLAIGLNIYFDYGVSWDEPVSRNNGMVSLKYVGEYVAPDFIERDNTLKQYPPLGEYFDKDYGVAFDLPLALLERLLALNDSTIIYLFRHLVTFLVFVAGVFAVYKLAARRFNDWRLGLLAALFLILSPRLFAESFYNGKDVVFMALFAITLNTTVLFIRQPTIQMACWHALATAILIDVRIMGVILPVATIIMVLLKLGRSEVSLRSILSPLFIYLFLSVLLVVVFWPYLWSDPWGNFVQAFVNMSKFRWQYSVLYLGQSIDATELPWHYIPVWLSITTPIAYTLLFFIGAISILLTLISRRWSLWQGEEEWQDLLFLGLFISPIISVIVLDSVLYDGWRQMYFIYPAFILVALRGWVTLFKWQVIQPPFAWSALVGLSTLLIFLSISVWMIHAHPFQNVYFNVLAGREVKTKFDVDYWGLSSRQALQYIVDHDNRSIITVWAGSFLPLKNGTLLLAPDDRERLTVVNMQDSADYIVTQYRQNLTDYSAIGIPYKTFYQINVDDEAIISVFKRESSD